MDSTLQHPAEAGSSSTLLYTPSEAVDSNPRRPPVGSLKLQTEFGEPEDTVQGSRSRNLDDDDDPGYESGEKLQRMPAPYSMAEETQVVRKFDYKLVPFLALLYLLSFLDRSSMLDLEIRRFSLI